MVDDFGIMENINAALHAVKEDDPDSAFWKMLCLSEILSLSLSYGFTSKTKYAKQLVEQGISTMQEPQFMPLQQTETAGMLLQCSEFWSELPPMESPITTMKVCELTSTQKPVLIYVRDREMRTVCSLSKARTRRIKQAGIAIIFYSRFYEVDPNFDDRKSNLSFFRNFSTHCFNEPPVDQEFVYITNSTSNLLLHAHGTNPILQDSVFLGFISFAYPTSDFFRPTSRSLDQRLLSVFFDEVDDIVTVKLKPGGHSVNGWQREETFSVLLHSFRLSDEQAKAMRLENGYILKRCDDSIPIILQLYNSDKNGDLIGEWKHYCGVETTTQESAGRLGLSTELIETILFDFAGWKGCSSGVETGLADIDTFLENDTTQQYFYKDSSAYLDIRNTAMKIFHERKKPSKEHRDRNPVQETTRSEYSTGGLLHNVQNETVSPTSEAATFSPAGVQTQPTTSSRSFQNTAHHVMQQQQQTSPRYDIPSPPTSVLSMPQQPSPHAMAPPQQQNFFPMQQQQMYQQQFPPQQQPVMQPQPVMQQQVGFPMNQNWQQFQQVNQNQWQQFQQNPAVQPNTVNQVPTQMTAIAAGPGFVTAGSPTPMSPMGFGAGSPASTPGFGAATSPASAFAFPNQPQQFVQAVPAPQVITTNPMMQQNVNAHPMMHAVPMMQMPQQQHSANPIFVQQNQMMGNPFPQQQRQNMMINAMQMNQRNMMNMFQQPNSPQGMMQNPFQQHMGPGLVQMRQQQQIRQQQISQQFQQQQQQQQMPQMPFMVPPNPVHMSATEKQAFINLQRLISTPIGQRLLANPNVTTQQIMQLLHSETQQPTAPTQVKHNDAMARAIAARHRENFESEQRDIDNFRAAQQEQPDFAEDDEKTDQSDKDDRATMEFEFNADNETLENLGDSYKDNVALLTKRIDELESLKRSYSGGGFKKMRSVVNSAIRKLRGTLEKLTLEDELEHISVYPLHLRHRNFKGLEVKFVASPEDCAIVVQDVGFLRVKVRTFGRLACRDTLPRMDKVHAIQRQSRDLYEIKVRRNPVFRSHPNICKVIAEFMYFKLIPMEIHILGEKHNYLPEYFPIVWQVYGLIDITIPDWESRYFHSFQFNRMENVDLVSSIPLCTIDDAYFQALATGQKKFVFAIESTKEKETPSEPGKASLDTAAVEEISETSV